ncbi:MAG: GPP34 family phosphoprotein [Candidatus Aminicenantes bacterium]
MRRRDALRLHEEIMLLALRDSEGTVVSGTMYNFAVGGAVLAELMMEKRIEVEAVRKKKFARVLSSAPLGDPLLDECLAKIAGAKRRGELRTWVGKFAQARGLKHRVAQGLADRGILRVDEGKVLGIFTRKIYPEVDPGPERGIVERLRRAIFQDGGEVEPRTAVLLSLAKSADLLKLVFDRKELKGRKERIARVVNGELTGKATQEAIQAMQAAVMVAVIMPAAIAASTAGR